MRHSHKSPKQSRVSVAEKARQDAEYQKWLQNLLECGIHAVGVTLNQIASNSESREMCRRKRVDIFLVGKNDIRQLDTILFDPAIPRQQFCVKLNVDTEIELRVVS